MVYHLFFNSDIHSLVLETICIKFSFNLTIGGKMNRRMKVVQQRKNKKV